MWKRKRQQQSTEMTIAIERARERRMAEERRREEEQKAAAAKKLRALDEKLQKKDGQSDEDATDGDAESSPPAKFVNAVSINLFLLISFSLSVKLKVNLFLSPSRGGISCSCHRRVPIQAQKRPKVPPI